jgi:hypothetical protein
MVKSATREWWEIVPRCQACREAAGKISVIFLIFSLACRAHWILTRIKSGDIFGLKQQH